MFSKLKKLVSKDDDSQRGQGDSATYSTKNSPMQTLGPQLQLRFGRGVNYNMKIVIRGDRNVGKTCLLLRLQGLPFKEEYVPSEEIQVAHIQWDYKTHDDKIKVEIWDVVDKSKKRKALSGLKIQNGSTSKNDGLLNEAEVGLDAETLDVYKGAHGVIMMLDMTKNWTFDYVKKEMDKVPSQLPVLILVNHRDMGHHQTQGLVTSEMVASFIRHLDRGENNNVQPSPILMSESSMRNGFGLKYVYKFFNLPFLQLQREGLEVQLQQNQRDMQSTFLELECLQEAEDQNYEKFSENLGEKRRNLADKLRPNSDAEIVVGRDELNRNSNIVSPVPQSKAKISAPPAFPFPNNPTLISTKQNSAPTSPEYKSPAVKTPNSPKKAAFFSFKSTKSESANPASQSTLSALKSPGTTGNPTKVRNIHEFVPDEDMSGDFLSDEIPHSEKQKINAVAHFQDEDSDDGNDNPMVASFRDEVDIDEIQIPIHVPEIRQNSINSEKKFGENLSPENGRLSTRNSVEIDADSEHPILLPENNLSDFVHEEVIYFSETVSQLEFKPELIIPDPSVITSQQSSAFSVDELSSWLESVEKKQPSSNINSPPETPAKSSKPKKDKKKSKKKNGTADLEETGMSKKSVSAKSEKAVLRKSPEKDEQQSLNRQLEDFLASDDE